MNVRLPTFDEIRDAAARIAPHAVVTPVWRNATLDALAGAALHFKCENLQRGGAFKFRGACNAVWSLAEDEAACGVVTHSSGNHGNALAMAAATRGMAAHVVVPEGAIRAKLEAIEQAGATLHRCAPTIAAREAKAAQVQQSTGAVMIHPYENTHVMAGQGTAVLELLQQSEGLDAIIAPVGGGGLLSGCAIAAHGLNPAIKMYGAEPSGASDAAQSLARGSRMENFTPDTLCDGLRALIGESNLAALREHRIEVITVSDEETIAAMKLLWQHLKLVVEVSSATALAAVLKQRERFAGRQVGIVLTGGNADLDALPW